MFYFLINLYTLLYVYIFVATPPLHYCPLLTTSKFPLIYLLTIYQF